MPRPKSHDPLTSGQTPGDTRSARRPLSVPSQTESQSISTIFHTLRPFPDAFLFPAGSLNRCTFPN